MITSIDQLDPEGTYTVADYLSWQLREQVELWKGKILRMSPAPKANHQSVSRKLTLDVGPTFEGTKCQYFYAPFDVYLPSDKEKPTILQPDACIVCDSGKIIDGVCKGAPDVIFEIISPSSLRYDTKIKFDIYEAAGVREYFIIFPSEQIIQQFVLKDGRFEFVHTDEAVGDINSQVLPDLIIHKNKLFKSQ